MFDLDRQGWDPTKERLTEENVFILSSPCAHSWDKSAVSLFSDALTSNASAATVMAVQILPEFGVDVAFIRSVGNVIAYLMWPG